MAVIEGVCGSCGGASLIPGQLIRWYDSDEPNARPVGAVCRNCHATGIRYDQRHGTYVKELNCAR